MEWRRVLAGVLLFLACFCAGFLSRQPDDTTNYENCIAIKKLREPVRPDGQYNAQQDASNHANSPDCRPPKWYAVFQRVEGWQLIVATIGIGIIAWQSWETRKASEATKLQSGTTARQLEIAERPWIYADASLAGPLVLYQGGVCMAVHIVIRNCGETPAVGVNIRPILYVLHNTKPQSTEERKRLCEELAKTSLAGETIFPGTTLERTYTINALSRDIEEGAVSNGRYYVMNLILCIAYRSTFGMDKPNAYYTGAIYDLYRESMNNRSAFVANKAEVQQNLRMSISPFFGVIAT